MPATRWKPTTATSRRWAATRWPATTSPTSPSCGPTACGWSSARSTSPSRWPAGPAAPRSWPATPWSSSPPPTPPTPAACWPSASATPACRDGVFNYVTGGGSTVGQALIDDPRVAGITFTGSFDVGMQHLPQLRRRPLAAPVHRRDGRQEPGHRLRHANLEEAATGIVRSAFGLQGQKCSANSRIFVEAPGQRRPDRLIAGQDRDAEDGRPHPPRELAGAGYQRHRSYREFSEFSEELSQAGQILTGGHQLTYRRASPTATTASPPWSTACPPATACGSTRCSCPSP